MYFCTVNLSAYCCYKVDGYLLNKTKRYACLVAGNVRNFYYCNARKRNCSRLSRGLVTASSLQGYSHDLQHRMWCTVPRFFCVKALEALKSEEKLSPTRNRAPVMKRLVTILSFLPLLTLCSCGNNKTESTKNDAPKSEVPVDSLAIALHELDSLLNCGTLIHLDVYEIGKLKSVSIAVHKLTVADRDYSYINFRKDCGGEYYYSWEDAMLLNDECKYLLNALNTIMQNNKRAVDHEERYAYSTKDDIAVYATSDKSGSNWTMRFSVDYNKSNSSITLTGEEMGTLKELILKAQEKIAELK